MIGRWCRHGDWLGALVFWVSLVSTVNAVEPSPNPELFQKLNADEFADRRSAQEELVEWGKEDPERRVWLFREQQDAAKDPEVQERCRAIVKELAMIIIENSRPGFIGIEMKIVFIRPGDKVEVPRGVEIQAVRPDTAAEEFGLKGGDLIVGIDEMDLSGQEGRLKLQKYVSGKIAGAKIQVHVERDGKKLELPLTLMPRPRELDLLGRLPFNRQPNEPLTGKALEQLREREYQNWLRESKNPSDSGR